MTVRTPKYQKRTQSNSGASSPATGAAGFGVTGYPTSGAKRSAPEKTKAGIAPWKIILATILIGLAGYFYLTHLFTTQAIYQEVQQLEQEHESARRIYEDRRMTYERMTGPVQVYERAAELGFIHGGATDPIIEIE